MKTKTVWAVYFSGTGTTRKVITHLSKSVAQGLGASWQEYCFNLPQARQKELIFNPEDLVVMGVPVYAGRVPNKLLPYIRDMIQGGDALAVPVVLYGNRNFDDALIELRNVMRDNSFHPITAGAFVGEHSFSQILGAGRPDNQDMSLVQELADKTIDKVKKLTATPVEVVAVEGCEPIRPYYTPKDKHGEPIKDFLKAKPVTVLDKCVKCGLCAHICPMGAIDPNDESNVIGKCIKCCSCIKRCPTGAKYFDHESYLYHLHDLEDQYAGHRAESKIFL